MGNVVGDDHTESVGYSALKLGREVVVVAIGAASPACTRFEIVVVKESALLVVVA